MEVTVFSDALYSNLIDLVDFSNFAPEVIDHPRLLNGLVLLQHYDVLKAWLDSFRCGVSGPSNHSLLDEMELLVDGLLSDGDVFKSLGYENLYEHGFLDFKLWKKFQQDSLQRGISALEECFSILDDDSDDKMLPSVQHGSFDQQPMREESVSKEANDLQNFPKSPIQTELGAPTSIEVECLADQEDQTDNIWADLLASEPDPLGQKGSCLDEDLFVAAEAGNLERVQLFLDLGANPNPESRGADGNAPGYSPDYKRWTTPLAEAVRRGDTEMAGLLLDRGAILVNEATKGWDRIVPDPVIEAVLGGNIKMGHFLFNRRGGSNDSFPFRFNQITITPQLRVYLSMEVRSNTHPNGVQAVLLDCGSKSPELCAYLFLEACLNGRTDAMQSVLDLGLGQFQSGRCNFSYWTTKLFQENEQVDQLRRQLENPLVLAASSGHQQKVDLLLELGANVNTLTSLGTPLSLAAQGGHESVVRQLLRKGANINEAALFLEHHTFSRLSRVHKRMNARKMGRSASFNPVKLQNQQHLHRKFIAQHILMLRAAERSSTDFRELSQQLPTYRRSWSAGIRTLRNLSRGETPTSFADVMAFLFLAKSISDTLEGIEGHDRREDFFRDLGRWKLFFTSASDIDAYRDAINSMWGVDIDACRDARNYVWNPWVAHREVLVHFQELATTLISQARDQLGLDTLNDSGLESSQQRWRLRNDKASSSANSTDKIPDVRPSGQHPPDILHPQAPDPAAHSTTKTLNQEIKNDVSATVKPLVILLMAGAIFAIVLIFLQWLQSVSITISNLSIFCGISTLEERCWILERYMGLKEYQSLIPESSIRLEEEVENFDDFFDSALYFGDDVS